MSVVMDFPFTGGDPSAGRSTTFGKLSDKRFAEIRASAAAVLRQKQHQVAKGSDVRALDNLPPPLFRDDKVGSDEDGEVAGERALTEPRRVYELPGGNALRFATHQTPEGVEAGWVRESSKGLKGAGRLHPSAFIDGTKRRQILSEIIDEWLAGFN